MQEMMKAMMQGQGGDQFDMEEMQRKCALPMFQHSSES
jgi:signal recognition particle subunit SRP54